MPYSVHMLAKSRDGVRTETWAIHGIRTQEKALQYIDREMASVPAELPVVECLVRDETNAMVLVLTREAQT